MPGRTEEPFGRGQTILSLSNGREQLLHDEEILAALGYEPVGFLHSEDAIAACGSSPADLMESWSGVHCLKRRRVGCLQFCMPLRPTCQFWSPPILPRHLMLMRWWQPAFPRW